MLFCGISNVTLIGTTQDWCLLQEKVDRLLKYDIRDKDPVMKKWHGLLLSAIDKFVQSVEGKPNLYFWDTIAHYSDGGSGPTYLWDGWQYFHVSSSMVIGKDM